MFYKDGEFSKVDQRIVIDQILSTFRILQTLIIQRVNLGMILAFIRRKRFL
jgi:hypothetical protein